MNATLIALKHAHEHLQQAAEYAAQSDQSLDLFAEELRLTQDRLNSITGEFTSDDLFGVIFSRFVLVSNLPSILNPSRAATATTAAREFDSGKWHARFRIALLQSLDLMYVPVALASLSINCVRDFLQQFFFNNRSD